jgi:methyl-accepting chemotaxis protein
MNKIENKSPLGNSDPISQYYDLINNINSLRYNIAYLAEKLGEQVPIQNIPCEFSKFITNTVCSITDKINDGSIDKFVKDHDPNIYNVLNKETQQLGQYSNYLTQKLNNLKNNVSNSVENVTNSIENVEQSLNESKEKAINKTKNTINKSIDNTVDNTVKNINDSSKKIEKNINNASNKFEKKVKSTNKAIKIGGGDSYNQIINPETGRIVSIHSKKGREILNNYIKK